MSIYSDQHNLIYSLSWKVPIITFFGINDVKRTVGHYIVYIRKINQWKMTYKKKTINVSSKEIW